MSVVHVVEWCLWLFLIDFDCLECKWPTSNSLPILSSSCRSWHANSFEMTLWKVKKWDMFIQSIVWVPASSDMIIIRETVETRRNCHKIFYYLQFVVLFGNDGLNWLQWTVVLLFYYSIKHTRVEEKMWRKEEEVNEFTTNPEPSLGEIEILRLFWMEGVSISYTIPTTLLSPVSYCFVLNNE